MVSEVLGHLFDDEAPARPTLVVDGTVGLGGHALAVLERSAATRVLGLDRDAEALTLARERLAAHTARVRLVQASYAELADVLSACEEEAPWGVLLDLGASSLQFDDPARGFSFRAPSPDVDMRFDRTSEGPTALELVNELPEAELSRIVHEYGEEPRARAVARAIVEARPITDGARLVEVVRRNAWRTRRHDAATRTFQALRIAVNEEYEHIERGLGAALDVVAPNGRVVVLSFHSGEDRLVKNAFRDAAKAGRGAVRTKKPQRPSEGEVRENPRARPAKLRAFERSANQQAEEQEQESESRC
jgi:16S rRNA (cytosine1402-N4)-methyltransferase